jgi:LacI family transcriptional regulator
VAKVTRDDVARLAGTSTAVVSYVINNGPRPVAPATRERVLAAIKELGYRPDRVAQAMASRRTDLIGLIIPDARQPFFGEMAHAVEQAASATPTTSASARSTTCGPSSACASRA